MRRAGESGGNASVTQRTAGFIILRDPVRKGRMMIAAKCMRRENIKK